MLLSKNVIFLTIIITFFISPTYAQIDVSKHKYLNQSNIHWSRISQNAKEIENKFDGAYDSDLIQSGLFVKEMSYATNSTLDKISIGYDGGALKGITTRQLSGANKLYKKCVPSVVLLFSIDATSLGSGTIINNSGQIITNWHVVKDQDKMLVWFYQRGISDIKELDKDNYAIAEVIAFDQSRDLAMLQLNMIDNKGLSDKIKPVKLGRYYTLDVAQDVFAIGHPEMLAWSFTYGVISQIRKNYQWKYGPELELEANVIQTQTPTNPGNSGGPLFDDRGALIGINSFGSQGSDGLNFAISVDEVKSFLKEVESGEHEAVIASKSESTEASKDTKPVDTNDNGIIDMIFIDLDGDGTYELALVDENEDSETDFMIGDMNNDSETDLLVYDKDENGTFEYFLIDTNYDGAWDTSGVDTDGDLEPDVLFDYTG